MELDEKYQLIALKVVIFCWYAASACLMPYQTIHMKMLGITVEETAIVYTVLPFAQILASPMAGFIADKIGNYKPVLCISLIGTIITSFAMMVMPSSGDPDRLQSEEEKVRHQTLYGIYFTIRILFAISSGTVFNMLDSTAVALAEKLKSNFGVIRFWGILGTGLFSPICGGLVDYLNVGRDEYSINYSPTFYFFNFFILLTLISSLLLNIEVAAPPKNMLGNVKKLLKSFPVWILFVIIFILGTLWGFVESYLFWYLLDLGAPKLLLGFTLTTGALISLPFLVSAEWFVKKFGYANLMIIALAFYFIRCFGYSLISSPYWCFPFEAMEVFTYHLMWVAAITYSAELAPEGLRATMIGCVGSLHYGIGRASGSMIGGTLMAVFNARLAFRYLGIVAGVSTILYTICYYAYLRKYDPPSLGGAKANIATESNTTDDCKVAVELNKEPQPNGTSNDNIELGERCNTQEQPLSSTSID